MVTNVEDFRKINLEFACINVNSFNVSTIYTGNSKSLLKVEGVTSLKHDIIFLSDCRLNDKRDDISKLFGLNRNASYRLYTNSSSDSRGVGIAIKRNISQEIIESYSSIDQNVILLKITIKGCRLIIGAIYGPNENKPEFYNQLRIKIEQWGIPFIIGGDFNTILDQERVGPNLDKIGEGCIPNARNGRAICDWIQNGDCIEPFRAKYPEQREYSYIPFRNTRIGGAEYGKTRLDFFLIHRGLIDCVSKIKYEDKLSHDFDHRMVSLTLGKFGKKPILKIFDDTLTLDICKPLGIWSIIDALNSHAVVPNAELALLLGNMRIVMNEYLQIKGEVMRGYNDLANITRLNELWERTGQALDLLPELNTLIKNDYSCNWNLLYEAIANSLKNALLELQTMNKKWKIASREQLLIRVDRMRASFGEQSEQYFDMLRELNDFDDHELKIRANKYGEFILSNNEKPTRAFCLLGKENNLNDDISQIRDDNGIKFVGEKELGGHIKEFYSNLYKKRLDNLIRIENFLGIDLCNEDWVKNKMLSMEEREQLEGGVTLIEMERALKSSNMNSSTGWDGISYKVIQKFFEQLGPVLVKLANESFQKADLCSTFKMGQIKLIPKKR